MVYMIGIGESANPLLAVIPIVLVLFSGYSTGAIISKTRKINSIFVRDLIYGNIILNFLFVSGFIIFGVLTYAAIEYFTVFTYMLVGLSILGIYILFEKLIWSIFHGVGIEYAKGKIRNFKSLLTSLVSGANINIFIPFGAGLLVTLLVYQAVIIYFHPIYSEYDSIFRFLPISKSILLGNGLNHDFYLGSDVNMRFPPFVQAVNAWLMHSFDYSSMRMFPFYYVFFAVIFVYYLTRIILSKISSKGDASFFGLIASWAFLITPAILVTSSRFSLQQDIPFILFLTASFYFLSEIVRYDKPAKTSLLMLSASLALMTLTRELGLVISIAIFFMVPAIKYTEGNLRLRLLFTVLSFLPLYILSLKDLLEIGITYTTSFRLITLLLANMAIFYITSKLKNQNKFSSLIRPVSNFKYIAPLVIPAIFIMINSITFSGPFPNFSFSGTFSQYLPIYREISGESNYLLLDLFQSLQKLPRIDILFSSIALGSAFLFLKLVGLGRIIHSLKNNYLYSLLLILLILLLVIWSFLLQSGFQTSDIRHIAYFIPLLSVILVVGMKSRNESTYYTRLFWYGLMVMVTIYFLHYNLYIWNYNQHFGGFWIEPKLDAIITFADIIFAAAVIGVLILVELGGEKISRLIKKRYNPTIYVIAGLIGLLTLQIYTLSNSGIMLASPKILDANPPPKWETSLVQVINYLKIAKDGNVLSVRAPAIPFFTNRTDFDLFNPQTFSYSISPLLLIENSSALKEKISDMGIKYIVIPNESNPLYYFVKNLMNESKLLQIINSDADFDSVDYLQFKLFRYDPGLKRVNLLDDAHIWKSTKNASVTKGQGNLYIISVTNETKKGNNFAYLATQSDISQRPILLSVNYASKSILGDAKFKIEIFDIDKQKRIFSHWLKDTSGNFINQTFLLPKKVVLSKYLEFRLIISTNSPGEHTLNFKRIKLASAI